MLRKRSTILLYLAVLISVTSSDGAFDCQKNTETYKAYCLSDKEKTTMVVVEKKEDVPYFDFTLSTSLPVSTADYSKIFVGVAFSKDKEVGNDLVVYCIGSKVTTGLTDQNRRPVVREWGPISGVSTLETDGEHSLDCNFQIGLGNLIDGSQLGNETTFANYNLQNKMYVHLVRGKNNKEGPPINATSRLLRTSPNPVKLADFPGAIETDFNDLATPGEFDPDVFRLNKGERMNAYLKSQTIASMITCLFSYF